MDPPDSVEQRLTDLEIKACYAEDLLDQLNVVIVRQQQAIDLLQRELALLRQQCADQAPVVVRSLRDEMPPHY